MNDARLAAAFAAGLPSGSAQDAARAEVPAALRAALLLARSAHPELAVDPAVFLKRLGGCMKLAASPTRLRSAAAVDPAGTGFLAALAQLHAADLYLACACADGDRRALAELERRLHEAVPRAAARLRPSNSFVDEVAQQLRQKLLVGGPSGVPKILDYAGRGPLSQWLRAAALRVALNLLESQKGTRELEESALSRLPAAGPDPEVALVKRRYAPEFKAALEAALSGLPPKERNLLRLYFAQGLTVEEIGRMEGTHKSTISRWLSRSRAALLAEVRERLRARFSLSPAELDSLIGALRSQLHVSLSRVL